MSIAFVVPQAESEIRYKGIVTVIAVVARIYQPYPMQHLHSLSTNTSTSSGLMNQPTVLPDQHISIPTCT